MKQRQPTSNLSIVIPTYNRVAKLIRLVDSIWASDYPKKLLEIIVVNNNSSDHTAEAFTNDPRVRLINLENNLYSSGGRNAGLRVANGDYVAYIDDDNILASDCLSKLVLFMESHQQVGVAAPVMFYYGDKKKVWCAGGHVNALGMPKHLCENKSQNELPKKLAERVDYFPNFYIARISIDVKHDEILFPHNWAEQDYCNKVRDEGYRLATVLDAYDWHDVGSSLLTRFGAEKTFDQARSRIVYRKLYLNNNLAWSFFFIILLPVSTLVYIAKFLIQKDLKPSTLIKAYCKGTIAGLKYSRVKPV